MHKSNTATVRVAFDGLGITNIQIQRLLGYTSQRPADEYFINMIDEYIIKASQICEIKAGYVIASMSEAIKETSLINVKDDDGTELIFDVGKIVYNQLEKAEKIIIFLCTAGPGICALSNQLMVGGDMLPAYIVDMIGSEVVEMAMNKVQNEIEEKYLGEGIKITNRFSPGYCGWHVSEQQLLFKFLPKQLCGVTLLPSSLMQPEKSISGFIGVGEHVKHTAYSCNFCSQKDCIYRRLRQDNN